VPTNPAQDIHTLTTQLTHLIEQVKTGLAGEAIIQDLQLALERLGSIATQDELTGALNRRGVLTRLDDELDRAKRTGHSFSIAVIAIDQYHALSEQYGSAISDQVLKNLTKSVLALIRSLDSFGRISDNEFALILPTTWIDQSEIAIGRLTNAVGALDWAAIVPSLAVTFSTGLTANVPGDTGESMIVRAGQALILAKSKGPGSTMQLERNLPDFDPGLF
jgi:diguanylate cyclase (GGDEF)-like protein